MPSFGENLRRALQERKLTQEDAAELCGVKQQAIAYYFGLDKPPRASSVQLLSTRLNVPLGELLAGFEDLADKRWLSGEGLREPLVGMMKSAGKRRAGRVAEAGPRYMPGPPTSDWALTLRRRWKKKESARPEMELALRVLFGDDADAILKWLEAP